MSPITVKLPSHRPSLSITVALAVHRRRTHAAPCRPSSSSHRQAVPRRPLPPSPSPLVRVAVAPSIAVHCHPPSIAVDEPSIGVHCHQSVHCCPANTPSIAVESIAVESPARRQLPSIAIHRPSPLSRRCIFHCCPCHQAVYRRRIAVAPSIVHCRPASITEVLSIAVALSIAIEPYIAIAPSIAVSHPAGCCVASRHVNASCPPVEEFLCGMFNLFLMRGTIL